mmetsp:Transcript_61266/g.145863  ORF Transcript_61266/g.145863 Transcript_61266/m.145863 type:complete len:82 (+) Transcript_61266:697-942(+)
MPRSYKVTGACKSMQPLTYIIFIDKHFYLTGNCKRGFDGVSFHATLQSVQNYRSRASRWTRCSFGSHHWCFGVTHIRTWLR